MSTCASAVCVRRLCDTFSVGRFSVAAAASTVAVNIKPVAKSCSSSPCTRPSSTHGDSRRHSKPLSKVEYGGKYVIEICACYFLALNLFGDRKGSSTTQDPIHSQDTKVMHLSGTPSNCCWLAEGTSGHGVPDRVEGRTSNPYLPSPPAVATEFQLHVKLA